MGLLKTRRKYTYILTLMTMLFCQTTNFNAYAIARDNTTMHDVGVTVDSVTMKGDPETKSITVTLNDISMKNTPESYRGGHNGGNTWYFTEVNTKIGKRINCKTYGDNNYIDAGWTIPRIPSNILYQKYTNSKGEVTNFYVKPDMFEEED